MKNSANAYCVVCKWHQESTHRFHTGQVVFFATWFDIPAIVLMLSMINGRSHLQCLDHLHRHLSVSMAKMEAITIKLS